MIKTGNKAPGLDGFTGEFYKQYVTVLAGPLLRACNQILTTGKSPYSWSQATVTVLTKENNGLILILFLNLDLKIFTSILANHLNTFIVLCIWVNQV